MPRERILVIEDDEDIQELIRHNLSAEGYSITLSGSGEDGLAKARRDVPDCILLDIMLPGLGGLEVCRELKKNGKTQLIPVLIVTARGEESDIVAGLELGADDYIVKPFSPRVLVARVRAIFRRKTRDAYNQSAVVTVKGIEIHPGRHEVVAEGRKLNLTHLEFQVLHLLASQPGWVFTRSQIIENVRSDNYPVTDRSVDVVIVGLRKKLGNAGDTIETVRGVGYRFTE